MDLSKAIWRKASRSHDDGDQCVEVTSFLGMVAVRDSKDPDGPKLVIGHVDFRNFASVLKSI
ncbi:DUF397 domain-containing protein [Actinomadura sp. KC345]|uniref:DUF397 domain-containing protein n=1 Tax=Actinomadura sp. KC345 TaxID=2530371 RepID=UPI00104D205F|nr:DUF397 domain-containing protein [Actinomadura sp. KC345]TDC55370.1 DUF397 domain-containing protein [Actinomadura sp. KC345]